MVAIDERLSFAQFKSRWQNYPKAFPAIWYEPNERTLYFVEDARGQILIGTAAARAYKFRATQAAVAAQTSAIAWFPTAPGQILDRLEIFVSVASPVKVIAGESITVASWTQLAPGATSDMNREKPVAPAVIPLTLSPFAPAATTIRRHPALAVNTPWIVDNLNVISPGNQTSAAVTANAVVIATEGVNLVLDVNMEWREYL